MKTIVNIRALLTFIALFLVTGAVASTLFKGYANNKLVSLVICILAIAASCIVFPLYLKADGEKVAIFYVFGIKREAKWCDIQSIVKSRGFFREFYFYPFKGKKKDSVKVDFPAYRKVEKLIGEYYRGSILK